MDLELVELIPQGDTADHAATPAAIDTPLPKKLMVGLGCAVFPDAFSETVSSPFMYFLVRHTSVARSEDQIARYVGILQGASSAAALLTSAALGWLSDRVGRRPVFVLGLSTIAIATTILGMCDSFALAVVARAGTGLLNANASVTKSACGDITDDSNRPRAYALYGSVFGITLLLGPLVGGFLSDPATHFPSLFANSTLFINHPYALPCFVSAGISCLGIIGVMYYLPSDLRALHRDDAYRVLEGKMETDVGSIDQGSRTEANGFLSTNSSGSSHTAPHPSYHNDALSPEKKMKREDSEITLTTVDPTSIQSLGHESAQALNFPTFAAILCYVLFAFTFIVLHTAIPLLCSTPVARGGLGLSPRGASLPLACLGAVKILLQTLIYPRLERKLEIRYGRALVFRWVSVFLALVSCLIPAAAAVRTWSEGAMWVSLMCTMGLLAVCDVFGYLGIIILITELANPAQLGFTHGIAVTGSSLARMIGPAICGVLFSWSLESTYGDDSRVLCDDTDGRAHCASGKGEEREILVHRALSLGPTVVFFFASMMAIVTVLASFALRKKVLK